MEDMIFKTLEKIRPALQRDGGDVKFIDVNNEGVVRVQLQGACGNCPGALMTIKMLIEQTLKNEVPGVKEVVGV
ncbi:NifU family protein [Desulfitobacterium hafniense]|uniref:NifU family protein n=1 Tax=Desulfitobacterium hafniense TaxID=49338 RepID=UPI000378BA95|nr:NifU family protein [Desulfitobacterium hafniense]